MCVRPIISNLATDLYEIFNGGRTMAVDERSEVSFSITQGMLPWQPIFGLIHPRIFFIALYL